MKIRLLCIALFISTGIFAQISVVKIMAWNLLNWPAAGSNAAADSADRCPYFRTVVQASNPDILVTEENNTTYSTTWFLNNVMNANGQRYSQGTYIHGYDTNNGIFFKDSLFSFVSNTRIPTSLRDINMFTLVFTSTGDTIRIFAVHLKAGAGPPNDSMRTAEVDSLRLVSNTLPFGSDFIVCGDFNIYGDFEDAYQGMLQDNPGDDGQFLDPLNLTGTWNNYAYRFYHTQSPRYNSFGGGASGGMDDRFDMILISNGMTQSSGFYYVPGSTIPFGNDGNHFNQSINDGFNAAVPANVADALYYSSDHLPIIASFQVLGTSAISEQRLNEFKVDIFPSPVSSTGFIKIKLQEPHVVKMSILDFSGRVIIDNPEKTVQPGTFEEEIVQSNRLKPGVYMLLLNIDKVLITKKLIVLN